MIIQYFVKTELVGVEVQPLLLENLKILPDKFNCIESIVIDFRSFNSKDFCSRIVLIYIPPSAHNSSMFSSLMSEFITFCASVFYRCCIMGVLNLPGVDSVNGLFPSNHEYLNICNSIFENGYTKLLMLQPGRVTY